MDYATAAWQIFIMLLFVGVVVFIGFLCMRFLQFVRQQKEQNKTAGGLDSKARSSRNELERKNS